MTTDEHDDEIKRNDEQESMSMQNERGHMTSLPSRSDSQEASCA